MGPLVPARPRPPLARCSPIWRHPHRPRPGGLSGVGFGLGQQKAHYLPAPHTDFIFSVVGEEFAYGEATAIARPELWSSASPRSTVATVTEIHDHLRLLYARAGTPYCPDHDLALAAQRGGVGYYRASDFVHIDTGRVRAWTG